jgi:hypothetical protein
MRSEIGSTRTVLQQSRNIADSADFLSVALLNSDSDQIENAIDDLLIAYNNYAGQAKACSDRYQFDEVAKLPDPIERDQEVTNGLAGALIDLEVAVLLGQAAQATGELKGAEGGDLAALDETVASLNETIQAIQGTSGTTSGMTRFAFDEVTQNQMAETLSPDVPTAKATYQKRVGVFYDSLLKETTDLFTMAFEKASGLDAEEIEKGIEAISIPLAGELSGRLTPRILESLQRAIQGLKGLLGPDSLKESEKRIQQALESARQGEGGLRLFLKEAYSYDQGQTSIEGWLTASQVEPPQLDNGSQMLNDLQQQMIQAFVLEKRIINNLKQLKWPLELILKQIGGTLPLDLVMLGAFILVADVALWRGMDYADTAVLMNWIEGVILTSKRILDMNG